MQIRIIAVVVLYKLEPEHSVSYRSLLRAATHTRSEQLDLHIVLYDNTPTETVAPKDLPPSVRYIADRTNAGLATAYNAALALATEQGSGWLLTLDQDTELPENTLERLLETIDAVAGRLDVGAIVPHIVAGGRVVSPNTFALGAWPRMLPLSFSGIAEEPLYAFNSGSLVRVSALQQLGGYSPWFPLDNSDLFLFRQLQRFGKRVCVADVVLRHDFSMLNLQERVSTARYRSILLSETAFWDLEMNRAAGMERGLRLMVRLVKHARRGDDRELRRLTRKALARRIFRSRRQRMELWRGETERRLGGATAGWTRPEGTKISVCLAAYNGERYMEAQLRSILPQLRATDELVIVDDASSDGTVGTIERVRREAEAGGEAPSILLVARATNQGVVRTFEEAVRGATGDILFLSDGDDLWAPDKVEKVMRAFADNPRARVVCTWLSLIDQHDQPLADDGLLRHRYHFTTGIAANLLHNQYQGSTMAFRSTLLEEILPFPADVYFLHDAWIGMRNTLSGGETVFLNEPLLLYRRHTGNYSGRLRLWKAFLLRVQLVRAQVRRAVR